MELRSRAEAIQTREDLAGFVLALRTDLMTNPGEWENASLDRFLEALSAWCFDMPGYFSNRGEEQPEHPDWRLVGRMLLAASMYE
jgi:hypothetical protein